MSNLDVAQLELVSPDDVRNEFKVQSWRGHQKRLFSFLKQPGHLLVTCLAFSFLQAKT